MIFKNVFFLLFFLLGSLGVVRAQSSYQEFKKRETFFKEKYRRGYSVSDKKVLASALLLRDSIIKEGYFDIGASMCITVGKLYQQLGMMNDAEKTYKEAIVYGQKVNDSLWLATAWERIGDFYALENRNYLSLGAHFKSLNLNEKFDISKKSIPENYASIAKAYIQSSEIEMAESYLQKALDLKKTLNDTLKMGIITALYADIYRLRKQYDKAIEFYHKDIPKRKNQKNFEGLFISYLGLGDTYFDWGKFSLAENAYQNAYAAADSIKRFRNMGLVLLKLGNIYQKINQTGKAKESYQKAIELCNQVDSRVYLMNAYNANYQLHKQEGNLDEALQNLEKYSQIYQLNVDETQQIRSDDLKAAFDLKEKENQIKNLDIENRESKQLQRILLLGIGLLLLLSAFLIILYRSRNQAFNILHQEQEQIKILLSEKESLLHDLQSTHHQLIHAEKMASLGVMMAGIAHEINNPVSSIQASAEALVMDYNELKPMLQLLSKNEHLSGENLEKITALVTQSNFSYLSQEMDMLLKTIINGSERTADIVSGLRTFTRDTGDSFLPYKVEEGLDAALVLLNHKIKNTIKIEKQYLFRKEVNCQISKINQVFVNVLDNAIQALKDVGIIVITTEEQDGYCVISIKDNGPGIEDHVLQKIFETFFTTKDVGSGTGLGLAISYAIIREHKGDIKVISNIGEGTTFKISIPLF
mgnify:CR=1 FL=1